MYYYKKSSGYCYKKYLHGGIKRIALTEYNKKIGAGLLKGKSINDEEMRKNSKCYGLVTENGLTIAVITDFAIKDEFKKKGHGTRIINDLLKKYNYVVIRISISSGFWKRFPHIDCDSDRGKEILNIIENSQRETNKLHLLKLHKICDFILVGKPTLNNANNNNNNNNK